MRNFFKLALPLHFHLVDAITHILYDVFNDSKYADKILEKCFKANRKWGARDRKFVAETVYEIVRHKRRLAYISESEEAWNLVGAYLFSTMGELPDWPEFDHLDIKKLKERNSAHGN